MVGRLLCFPPCIHPFINIYVYVSSPFIPTHTLLHSTLVFHHLPINTKKHNRKLSFLSHSTPYCLSTQQSTTTLSSVDSSDPRPVNSTAGTIRTTKWPSSRLLSCITAILVTLLHYSNTCVYCNPNRPHPCPSCGPRTVSDKTLRMGSGPLHGPFKRMSRKCTRRL